MRNLVSIIVVFGLLAIFAMATRPSLIQRVNKHAKEIKAQFALAQNFFNKANKVRPQLKDMSVECALCGIAVNEVEGFMMENVTEKEVEQFLVQKVCSWMGPISGFCDDLVQDIPKVIGMLEKQWTISVICTELEYCDKPFENHTDPQEVPKYVINLDLPPRQRFKQACSDPAFREGAQFLTNTLAKILPGGGVILGDIGKLLNDYYFPQDLGEEIQGCAEALGVDYGWVALLNLGYEVSDACTSIVAQTNDGKMLHARNMDFWAGMGFTDTLKQMAYQAEFQKGGKLVFHATIFAGYVGILSGMKPGAFALTVNTRFYPEGISQLFYEIIAAIEEKNASLVTFLARRVFVNENDFDSAVENLSNDYLIADVYYTVSGVAPGQGVVISRNRQNASDVWRLNAPTSWYEVETNYDHWEQPPWFDDRLTPTNEAMNAMGRDNLSLDSLYKVISTKPTLNLQTTYSILACAADGTYKSYVRWCPYPCVQ